MKGVLIILLVMEGLLVFVHLAVYETVGAAFGAGSPIIGVIFIALAFTFVSASLLARRYKNAFVRGYYRFASYWFGLIHFLFIGALAFLFSAAVFYSFNYYVSPALIGAVAFGAFFMLHIYGTWESGRARVTDVAIALRGLPVAWQGKRIVFVSDLHLGNVRGKGFVKKITAKINRLSPEAVFIGGDLYDGVACDAAALIEPLSALHVPQGVFFVTGNHEYYFPKGETAPALAAIRAAGIRVLDNERVDLEGVALIGVDDAASRLPQDLENIMARLIPAGERKERKAPNERRGEGPSPVILLKHEPRGLAVAAAAGVSLMLSGHTHHGQIFPIGYLTSVSYGGFDYGLKRFGGGEGMQVYISSGAGTWGPPLRLGTRSEIVCITLTA